MRKLSGCTVAIVVFDGICCAVGGGCFPIELSGMQNAMMTGCAFSDKGEDR
jgi:hypothetical protein